MVRLGFEPGAAGWQLQTKPRSYGGHRDRSIWFAKAFIVVIFKFNSLPIACIKKHFIPNYFDNTLMKEDYGRLKQI